MSTAQILVAIAGPSMNIVLAVAARRSSTRSSSGRASSRCPAQRRARSSTSPSTRTSSCSSSTSIPAPPLDGGHVAEGLMPYKHRATFENYARFGPFILMAVVLIPQLAQIFVDPGAVLVPVTCTRCSASVRRVNMDTGYQVALDVFEGPARSAASPREEARAVDPRHPDRVRHREVPRVPRRDGGPRYRRRRRVPR